LRGGKEKRVDLAPATGDKQEGAGCEEDESGGFGSGDGGVGVGLTEVVEGVGEVGEVDGGCAVEVGAGPGAGVLAEVV